MAFSFAKYGIEIDGSESKTKDDGEIWENRVRWLVLEMAKSDSGSALLGAVGKSGKSIEIKPYTKESEKIAGVCNAFAQPRDFVQATKKGGWVLPGSDDPSTPADDRFQPFKKQDFFRRVLDLPQEPYEGTGQGSAVELRFSPQMWSHGAVCAPAPGSPGSGSLQILFHEMVHAYRQVRGTMESLPTVGGRRSYDNEEEFFAIVVTNIYSSDPTNRFSDRSLRADHHGFTPLDPALGTSAGFLAQPANKRILARLVADEPDLCSNLKKVKGTFNPVAAL